MKEHIHHFVRLSRPQNKEHKRESGASLLTMILDTDNVLF